MSLANTVLQLLILALLDLLFFDLKYWPPVTSIDLWHQNNIVYNIWGYHMCMSTRNCTPVRKFQFWPLLTSSNLLWPLRWHPVTSIDLWDLNNIVYNIWGYHMSMSTKNCTPVSNNQIWPLLTSNNFWGQNNIVYKDRVIILVCMQKISSVGEFFNVPLIFTV